MMQNNKNNINFKKDSKVNPPHSVESPLGIDDNHKYRKLLTRAIPRLYTPIIIGINLLAIVLMTLFGVYLFQPEGMASRSPNYIWIFFALILLIIIGNILLFYIRCPKCGAPGFRRTRPLVRRDVEVYCKKMGWEDEFKCKYCRYTEWKYDTNYFF